MLWTFAEFPLDGSLVDVVATDGNSTGNQRPSEG
jgi:hypothetical protein